MTEDQLSALLRTVKRHEQPPPEYFDQFLREVHRRQRSELLRRPLWKIAMERMQTFFGEHSMGPVSYATAMVSVLVVGVTAIGVMMPEKLERRDNLAIAQQSSPRPAGPAFTLQQQPASQTASNNVQFPPLPGRRAVSPMLQPRYIIDSRPVSYERPSFSF